MRFRVLTILAILYAGTAAAQWTSVAGTMKQVAVAADGTTLGISPNTLVYKWTGSQWQQLPGSLTQITAGSAQQIWGVNSANNVFQWNGTAWIQKPGLLKYVSAAADGTVLGTNMDDYVFRFDPPSNNWTQLPGRLRVVSAGSAQEIWGVNSSGAVFRWNGSNWDPKPGGLAALSVGSDKSIWGVAPNGGVWEWVPAQSNWAQREGTLSQISVANSGNIWGVNSANSIFKCFSLLIQTISSTTTTITLTPTNTPIVVGTGPSATPTVTQSVVAQPGQLICTMNLSSASAKCDTRKAEYVGAYALNMKCSSGFFDPIYGGTCWKCPDDDGHGAWVRGTTPVTGTDACWRAPKEYFSAATRVSATAFAWDCASGSFWDPNGSCNTCPSTTPRRTSLAVTSDHACVSAVNETSSAAIVTYNGCSAPDATQMKKDGKLSGKTMPGKPFLDIAGGWSQSSASGGCYTCPTVDSDGNFLISMRNGNPIYGDNKGCTIYENYRPATFIQPGLSRLNGVKPLVLESNLLTPSNLLLGLHAIAIANGKVADSADARTWVGQQLSDMSNSPYRSTAFRELMLGLLTNALQTPAASRTASQQALIASMGTYATTWRSYVAQQMLDMYDAWKKWDDADQSSHKQSQIGMLFDYGTVPLDFRGLAASLGAPAAVGASLAGSLAAGEAFGNAINWVNKGKDAFGSPIWSSTNGLYTLLRTGNAIAQTMKVAEGVSTATAALSGATAIGIAGAILTSIASDQFQAIVTARPNLVSALVAAQSPVSFDKIFASGNGADQLQYHWIMAMDTAAETDDAQIVQLVRAAQAVASSTGYAAPK